MSTDADTVIGSWQCPHCFLTSHVIWRGTWNPDDAPGCCGGEPMLPYRIPSREALDVKIVSRWIDDLHHW
jgi:hypothetical protein